ncbi:MAG: FAD-binding oxidoreductase [Candidatus Rokubacteria bacterium]|nr:FAD-binding oxidoreductase [Candidatus Rokubacteria bacterium]
MSASLPRTLADIVGPAHCLVGADRGPFVVEGRTPAAVVFPGTMEEAGRVVAAAAEAGVPVIPWGGGTEMHLGAPPRDGAVVIVTRRLTRIVEHEPADLTATVEAGITMEALGGALGAKGQWVSLDPPFPARATLGGALAANSSGPRRYLYGTARDVVIGIRVVGADGVIVRAGGKVVKNVAGYDLAKLYIGSLGTLGLIVEATLKLRPRPEADRACWAAFGDAAAAGAAVRAVMASDLLPYAIELLDAEAGAACAAQLGAPGGAGAVLLLGFDGLPGTVSWQLGEAERLLAAAGASAVTALDEAVGARALAFARDIRAAVPEPLAVAKVALLPTQVGPYLAEGGPGVAALGLRLTTAAHAGSGIVRLVLTTREGVSGEASRTVKALGLLRDQARAAGGELVVEWAPLAVKEEISAWDAPGPAVRLMQRIKAQLDPQGIMNPGRFVGGL